MVDYPDIEMKVAVTTISTVTLDGGDLNWPEDDEILRKRLGQLHLDYGVNPEYKSAIIEHDIECKGREYFIADLGTFSISSGLKVIVGIKGEEEPMYVGSLLEVLKAIRDNNLTTLQTVEDHVNLLQNN
jgi:hypothetical protein